MPKVLWDYDYEQVAGEHFLFMCYMAKLALNQLLAAKAKLALFKFLHPKAKLALSYRIITAVLEVQITVFEGMSNL